VVHFQQITACPTISILEQHRARVPRSIGRVSVGANRWDEKAGLQRDALSSQVIDALKARETRRAAMKKLTITMIQQTLNKQDRRLTVGLDLGDRVELLLRTR
jgi:hypothetical protein